MPVLFTTRFPQPYILISGKITIRIITVIFSPNKTETKTLASNPIASFFMAIFQQQGKNNQSKRNRCDSTFFRTSSW